jgi:uncharacterized protein YbjT (DUF2867 family)
MIAVMGASGNVGSRVIEHLLDQERDVRVFGRSAERLEAFGRRGAKVVGAMRSTWSTCRSTTPGRRWLCSPTT